MPQHYPGEGYPDETFNWAKYGPIITCILTFIAVIAVVVVAGVVLHDNRTATNTQITVNDDLEGRLTAAEANITTLTNDMESVRGVCTEMTNTAVTELGYTSITECWRDMKARIIANEQDVQKLDEKVTANEKAQEKLSKIVAAIQQTSDKKK